MDETLDDNKELISSSVEGLDNLDELLKLLDSIEKNYGKIGKIFSKQIDSNGYQIAYKDSKNLEEFKKVFTDEDFKKMTNYKLFSLDKFIKFDLDITKHSLIITNQENKDRLYVENSDDIEYYMYNNNLIKRDPNIEAFYKKDKDGNWKEIEGLIDNFLDSNYTFIKIPKEEIEGNIKTRSK